jgi:hypothetical protein
VTDDLVGVLSQVRERVLRHRGTPIGEMNTRATLIEPVLRALGWDVGDLDEVHREYRRAASDNPVDYALLLLRTPRLFVEAKALGGDLDDRRWANQIMGYASVAGVEWVVLTNGDEYRIYNSHATVPFEQKLFRSISISTDLPKSAETLGLLAKERMKENWIDVLWKSHFIDRQIRATLEGLFAAEPDSSLVRLIAKRVPTLSLTEIRSAVGRVRIRLDFPVEPSAPGRLVTPPPPPSPEEPARTNLKPERLGWGDRTPSTNVSLGQLIERGLLKPPLDLENTYRGRRLTARIGADGRVTCLEERFDSVSTAAGRALHSVRPAPPGQPYPAANGWIFWHFRDADGQLRLLDELRRRYRQSTRADS